jgi:hypothetical protein
MGTQEQIRAELDTVVTVCGVLGRRRGASGLASTPPALALSSGVRGRICYESIGSAAGKDGAPEFTDIAQTDANSVRIVWNEEGSAAELDTAITNALAAKLIPMVEHHSATGKLRSLRVHLQGRDHGYPRHRLQRPARD